MSRGPKIVTTVIGAVTALALSLALGCTGSTRQLRQGESKLAEMQRIKAELAADYLVSLAPGNPPAKDLSPARRARVRELLTRFVTLSEDVLKLDESKGVVMLGRDRVESERDQARALLVARPD